MPTPFLLQQQQRKRHRKRRLRRKYPWRGLHKTHTFTRAASGSSINMRFDAQDDLSPFTVHIRLQQTAAFPNGNVFTMGNAVVRFRLGLELGSILIQAGTVSGDDHAEGRVNGVFTSGMRQVDLTMVARPDKGGVAVFVNNKLGVYTHSTSKFFNDGWGAEGIYTFDTPTGAVIEGDVDGFDRQWPRVLDAYTPVLSVTGGQQPSGRSYSDDYSQDYGL